MKGMTLKQAARVEFWDALAAYRKALTTKHRIVAASLRVHVASGSVPKQWKANITRVFNECNVKGQL